MAGWLCNIHLPKAAATPEVPVRKTVPRTMLYAALIAAAHCNTRGRRIEARNTPVAVAQTKLFISSIPQENFPAQTGLR